ncbi:hypothetical protein Leryth_007648 [Lithospermum erythrorhizon]|nr:hypothetical protein Leryth_007648 [Lithospermum erythrorhizon]
MAKSPDFWRGYFSGQNLNICDIIENAVIVAALDYPNDLKLRRDHIAELLFTCNLTKCLGCDNTESNIKCFGDDDDVGNKEDEALNNEIEEESKLIGEVVRIKEILDSYGEESDSTLFESLRRLQQMDLSVEILKATEIGKSVNGLKKHGSKQIRDLVRALIEGWISLLDSWMNAIEENTSPESMKTSTVDFEEGLPCPPLDEGAFNAHSVELSEFDGMDNDGNPMTNGNVDNNRGSTRKPPVKDGSVPKQKHQQAQQLSNDLFAPQEKKVQQTMRKETVSKKKGDVVKTNKPSCGVTGSMRPTKTRAEQNVNNEMKSQLKRDERAVQKKPLTPQDNVSPMQREQQSANGAIRKKPLTPEQEIQNVRSSDKASIQVKIEATKRKLHERYQEAENAKKQRTIQVMELHDIPKQGFGGNHLMKPGQYNHKKNRTNGRH